MLYKMYTTSKDYTLNAELLQNVIKFNETQQSRLHLLHDYYIGNHNINQRMKYDVLKNNKVTINHAKYIVDTNIGYLMGNPVDYVLEENDNDYDIEPILQAYKKQTITDLDVEIAKNTAIYGYQYEYIYSNEQSEPKSCIINNENAILVYDDTVEHNKLFGLIYNPVREGNSIKYYEVMYIDKKEKRTFQLKDNNLTEIDNKEPHAFGDVPLILYKNNPDYTGDFECVISLLDAYNLLQSDRINDKEQLVDAILIFYGMDLDDVNLRHIKDSRMISMAPIDSKAEYLVKTLHEADVDVLRANIENDIHKISMTPNMSDVNFANNSSGVAIRYKLLGFEQNIKNKERYFEKGLMERFKLYNNFLTVLSKMQDIPLELIDARFTRNLPSNDLEISQMINNLADLVDKETLLSQLSFITDASKVVENKEKEDESKEVADPSYLDNDYNELNGEDVDNV